MTMQIDLPTEVDEGLGKLAQMRNQDKDAYAAAVLSDHWLKWNRQVAAPASPRQPVEPPDPIALGIANGTIYPPKRAFDRPLTPANVDPDIAKAAIAEFEARL